MHDYITLNTCAHLIDNGKELGIFPRTQLRSDFSNIFLDAVRLIADVFINEGQLKYLNMCVLINSSEHNLSTYIERACVLLHDAVLANVLSTFLSGLPSSNTFCTSGTCDNEEEEIFARQLYSAGSYYSPTSMTVHGRSVPTRH